MPDSPPLTTALGTILQPLALKALNAATDDDNADGAGGPPYAVPSWIPLMPAGPVVAGVDGRTFQMDDTERVVNRTRLPIVLDWDHASALGPFSSQPGKAAARIVEMEMRNEEIWGRCEWTAAGRQSVEAGEYLYISPVLRLAGYYEDEPPQVRFLTSAALVNSPNFNQLPSLNQQESRQMKPPKNTPAAADPDATETGAAESTEAASAEPAAEATESAANANVNIETVPRAELEAAMTNMNALRGELAAERQAREDERQAQHETAINAALDKAVADRKILPSSRDYFLAQCRAEGGLEAFNSFVDGLPQMLPDSGLDNAQLAGPAAATVLTANEQAFCNATGIEPEKYLETKKERAAKRALAAGQPPAA